MRKDFIRHIHHEKLGYAQENDNNAVDYIGIKDKWDSIFISVKMNIDLNNEFKFFVFIVNDI